MQLIESVDRNSGLIQQLLIVWEKSVRATHLFLSDSEIKKIYAAEVRNVRFRDKAVVGIAASIIIFRKKK